MLALTLTGCEQKPKAAELTYASIGGYNYTEEYIHQFYIDGAWGGNVRAYGGGGSVCCVGVPKQWRPGLKATVRWTTSASRKSQKPYNGETWHEQLVPIDPYDKTGGRLNVHFLPDYKTRLIVSEMGPRAIDYPGPAYPEPPADWSAD